MPPATFATVAHQELDGLLQQAVARQGLPRPYSFTADGASLQHAMGDDLQRREIRQKRGGSSLSRCFWVGSHAMSNTQ